MERAGAKHMPAFTLAHLSDLHVTPVRVRRPLDFLNKRFLGALSWSLRRRREYRPEVLAALVSDLHTQGPDHVVITGDLTNIALEDEFSASLPWLQKLGGPQQVSVIPGNHDTYTRGSESLPWTYWADYMRSHIPPDTLPDPALRPSDFPPTEFPTLRTSGPVALVGVSTARATAPFYASGTIGRTQLDRLERLLGALAHTPLGRVVLIHHPPQPIAISARRRLTDAAAFRAVLAKTGAELILHGHMHRTVTASIPGPWGPIPVVGVPASAAIGRRPQRRSRYHLYRIEPHGAVNGRSRFQITLTSRAYDPRTASFHPAAEQELSHGLTLDSGASLELEAKQSAQRV